MGVMSSQRGKARMSYKKVASDAMCDEEIKKDKPCGAGMWALVAKDEQIHGLECKVHPKRHRVIFPESERE